MTGFSKGGYASAGAPRATNAAISAADPVRPRANRIIWRTDCAAEAPSNTIVDSRVGSARSRSIASANPQIVEIASRKMGIIQANDPGSGIKHVAATPDTPAPAHPAPKAALERWLNLREHA